ncbi:tetratricopeptide repeat protein [Puteibacter caeruleilacunae]|nr:tetratricopeptide repeat protein [Puteibacter caeruleilacunae]
MKRTVLFLALAFATSGVFAQKGKVASAQSFKDGGKLDKALEAINTAIDSSNPKAEKSIIWPRTWEVRGEIYQAIFSSKDANYKKLDSDPLTKALESYKKALEIDEKNKYGKSVKIKLTLLNNDFTNMAIEAFNEKDFEKALVAFESILSIEELPVFQEDNAAADTVIIYNAGLSAYNAKNWDKAVKYYTKAAELGYNGARTWELIAETQQNKGDTVALGEALNQGFLNYPEDKNLLFKLINYYLLTVKDAEKALKFCNMAIEKDQNNASIHFAKGTLYDAMDKPAEAIGCYQKSVEIDPTYFDAHYNLGAVYFNKGVKQLDIANAVPTDKPEQYEEEKAKADVEFKKAIPHLEKAMEIKPEDKTTLETLKNLYYRLKMMDKFNKVQDTLNSL